MTEKTFHYLKSLALSGALPPSSSSRIRIIDSIISVGKLCPRSLLDEFLNDDAYSQELQIGDSIDNLNTENILNLFWMIFHILKEDGTTESQLEKIISKYCFPFLSFSENHPLQYQICLMIAEVICEKKSFFFANNLISSTCFNSFKNIFEGKNNNLNELKPSKTIMDEEKNKIDFQNLNIHPSTACFFISSVVYEILKLEKNKKINFNDVNDVNDDVDESNNYLDETCEEDNDDDDVKNNNNNNNNFDNNYDNYEDKVDDGDDNNNNNNAFEIEIGGNILVKNVKIEKIDSKNENKNSKNKKINSKSEICGNILEKNVKIEKNDSKNETKISQKVSSKTFLQNIFDLYFEKILNLIFLPIDENFKQKLFQFFLPCLFEIFEILGCKNLKINEGFFQKKTNILNVFKEDLSFYLWNFLIKNYMEEVNRKKEIIFFIYSFMEKLKPFSIFGNNFVFDLRKENTFWEILKFGLVNDDIIIRKQSLTCLKFFLEHQNFIEYKKRIELKKNNFEKNFEKINTTEHVGKKKGKKNNSKKNIKNEKNKNLDAKTEEHAISEDNHIIYDSFNYDHIILLYKKWEIFFLLFETLDEFSIHLTEAVWPSQIEILFPSQIDSIENFQNFQKFEPSKNGNFNSLSMDIIEIKNKNVDKNEFNGNAATIKINENNNNEVDNNYNNNNEINKNNNENSESFEIIEKNIQLLIPILDFSWIEILFLRGINHKNSQVKKLIFRSFLNYKWKLSSFSKLLSNNFIFQFISKVLNDSHFHHDFGINGNFVSESCLKMGIFFSDFSSTLSLMEKRIFIFEFSKFIYKLSPSRCGLFSLIYSMHSFSLYDQKDYISSNELIEKNDNFNESEDYLSEKNDDLNNNNNNDKLSEKKDDFIQNQIILNEFLISLHSLIKESKKHFNPKFREKIILYLIQIGKKICFSNTTSFDALSNFIHFIQKELLKYNGQIYFELVSWIEMIQSDDDTWIKNGMNKMINDYFDTSASSETLSFSDADVLAWENEANKITKMTMIMNIIDKNILSIIISTKAKIFEFFSKSNESKNIFKLLILLQSLIKEINKKVYLNNDNLNENFSIYGKEKEEREKKLFWEIQDFVNQILSFLFQNAQKKVEIFLNSNEIKSENSNSNSESMSMSKSKSKSNFNSNSNLILSIGQLGGPVSRNLSEKMSTVVISTILYIQTISKCLKWLNDNFKKIDETFYPSISFLLKFCTLFFKKDGMFPISYEPKSELHLAAVEALDSVLQSLAEILPRVNFLSFSEDVSMFILEKSKPETFFLHLLFAIQNFFKDSKKFEFLKRSRISTLETLKWSCFFSSLQIYKIKKNNFDFFLSDHISEKQILNNIFDDCIESLDKVNDENIIPLFQCVRILIDFDFLSLSKDSEIQKIYKFVQFSWTALTDFSKRKFFPLSIFLRTIIHPKLFSCPKMHIFQNGNGPIKWLLNKLMLQGNQSPRTMKLTALQFTNMFILFPKITNMYIEEICTIALYGSDEIDEDIDFEKYENENSNFENFLYSKSADPELTQLFSSSEIYPRICITIMLHKFSLLNNNNINDDDDDNNNNNNNNNNNLSIIIGIENNKINIQNDEINEHNDIKKEIKKENLVKEKRLKEFEENILNDEKNANEDDEQYLIHSINCGLNIFLNLLQMAINCKEISKEVYKKKSSIHRKKIRIWQMICILSSKFLKKSNLNLAVLVLETSLYKNNLPSVRQYIEIFGIQIFIKFPYLINEKLVPTLNNSNLKNQSQASYVFIATNLILNLPSGKNDTSVFESILPAVIPYMTSHHHNLRCFTQVLLYKVLIKYPFLYENENENKYSKNGNFENENYKNRIKDFKKIDLNISCFKSLKYYLENNEDCAKLRKSVEKYFDNFDIHSFSTPKGIFIKNDFYKENDDDSFECISTSLFEKVSLFLCETRENLREEIFSEKILLNDEEQKSLHKFTNLHSNNLEFTNLDQYNSQFTNLDPTSSAFFHNENQITAEKSESNSKKIENFDTFENSYSNDDFQKKIVLKKGENIYDSFSNLNLNLLNNDELRENMNEENIIIDAIENNIKSNIDYFGGKRQNLIMVASLIDRIPNLAGLARTCEIFKVNSLVLSDLNVINDRHFQSISVTAEKWLPLLQIQEENLVSFLNRKKKEGFSIIGLEQTTHSRSIQTFTFPIKTVLVLGKEKEGIPPNIIQTLNCCVHIPQFGILRSLNVHVSASIATWEYTKQIMVST